MTDTTARFRKQLPRNLIFQILAFVTQVGIGIWLVPYLIGHLGTAAYGLVPLAGVLTAYVSLISQSISQAVNRFLTIALQQDDALEANRVFSTAFFSYLAIGLLQIPLFALLIFYANRIIAIPEPLYWDAIILLTCSAGAFIINLVASVFGVPMYAYNRIDYSRTIDISRHLLRVAGIVGFFVTLSPSLRYVGYVDLAISVILLLAQVAISKSIAPTLKLRLRHYDWRKIRQLVAMGGWLVVSNVGTLLILGIDVWVCNRFVSPEAAGEYTAVLQWPALIRHGGAIIAAVVSPMLMIYYAQSQREQFIRLSNMSVRLLSLVVAIPIAILCAFSPAVLSIWLGASYTHLAPLMVLMLFHLVVNVGVMPLFSVQIALEKVRLPALMTLAMGFLNVVLAIVFARVFQWGPMGVAVAGALTLTIKNAAFIPLYAALILNIPWYSFLRSYVKGMGLLCVLTAVGYVLNVYLNPTSWVQLILLSSGLGVLGLAGIWLILPLEDRRFALSLIRSRGPAEAKGS